MSAAARPPLEKSTPVQATVNSGTQIFVSFVVPALNEEKHIASCLQSIHDQDLPNWISGLELIVVDNHSTDHTVEISERWGARVIAVPPGLPSRARNAGASFAQGDWLAFVDADCILPTDWIVLCGTRLRDNTNIVAAAGVSTPPSHDASWIEHSWHEITNAANSSSPKYVRWLPTFNLLVRRAAFDQIGGFNESLATCEDCDLGYRLAKLGTLVQESRAAATHRGTSASLSEFFRREAWRTRGNLWLAIRRPFDIPNWISLLLPPCLVVGLVSSLTLVVASRRWPAALPYGVGMLLTVLAIMFLLTIRRSIPSTLTSALRRVAVIATFVLGRTAGLLLPFRRVEH